MQLTSRVSLGILLCMVIVSWACSQQESASPGGKLAGKTWGEKLGFPANKRVLILHADDVGMCAEANTAARHYLENDNIQSAAGMVPCAYFDELAAWYRQHPDEDIGLHLTLTSEWKTWRWGPVAGATAVPGLVDPDGYLWHEVPQVVQHASAAEVEREIRAQLEKAKSLGMTPGHIDTHMGTLYARLDYTQAYLKVAQEYNIPAMVISFSGPVMERFRQQGYPITNELAAEIEEYPMPKLDDFWSAPEADSYAQKKQAFFDLVRRLQPGITEIIFHPSVETDNLKSITNRWQQRVWEAQMFADPEVIDFLESEGVLFTNWKDMLRRYRERAKS